MKELQADARFPGLVNQGIPNLAEQQPAPQPEGPPLLTRLSVLLSGILDSFSFAFFCLPFSSLTHVLGSLRNRLF
jgi:hypothetical protein